MFLIKCVALADWLNVCVVARCRIVQPLEDLPRVKKARIQFTIEKADADGEDVRVSCVSCMNQRNRN